MRSMTPDGRFSLTEEAYPGSYDKTIEEAGKPPTAEAAARVADRLLQGAIGQGDNDFKIELARRLVVRGITVAAHGTVTNDTALKESSGEQAHE